MSIGDSNLINQPVGVIVLNWNNPDETICCLSALLESFDFHQIYVVDNGSIDDSTTRIKDLFPNVILIETGNNLGYAGGNNVGIKSALQAGVDYFFIVNNDVIVHHESIDKLLAIIQADSSTGIVTPLIIGVDEPEIVWSLGGKINPTDGSISRLFAGEPLDRFRHQAPFDVDVAQGAAMLVTRSVIESIGLMDEEYFLYFEEADWCVKANKAGFAIKAVPEATVTHKVSASLGITSPVIEYYMTRNQLRFILQHWHGIWKLRALCRYVSRTLLAILAYTVKSHAGKRIPNRNAKILGLRDAVFGHWGKYELNRASFTS